MNKLGVPRITASFRRTGGPPAFKINFVRMKMRLFAWGVLVICCITEAVGQGYIAGRVLDAQSRSALPDVHVMINREVGTHTDGKGYFILQTDTGNYNLHFSSIGYASRSISIHISQGDTLLTEVQLIPERSSIDQIVVSASRSDQKMSELTVSMDVLRPAAISRNHIFRAEELLNRSPGIEVLDGQASIRGGSGFSYGAGSRVLALIDGLPVISPDAGNIKWQFLPLENLSQVEVIKGASSVLYGSSALNGIINFRTATAGDQPVTRFYTEAGLYDSPRQKKWKWSDAPRSFYATSFSHLRREKNTSMGLGLHLMNDNGYRRLNGERLARLNLQLRQDSKKITGLYYGINLNAGLTRKTDFILWEDADSGALRQDTATAQELQALFLTVDPYLVYRNGKGSGHEVKMRLQQGRNQFPTNSSNNSDARSIYAEYLAHWLLAEKLTLSAGTSGLFSSVISEFYGDHTSRNISLYTQAEYNLVEKIKMIAGVRIEHYALDNESEPLVPVFRAGINYQAAQFTFLRASFGQGYRYPAIAEKFATTTIGSVSIYPSPELEPEAGWSSELGILQGFKLGMVTGKADLALFYAQNSSLIEYIFGLYPDPVTGISGFGFRAANIENSRVYGFENEWTFSLPAGDFFLTGSTGYTYMYPVEFNAVTGKNTDIFLKYRRKHSFKADLDVSYRIFTVGSTLQAKSPMLNIDDVFVNPFSRESILPGFFDYWTTHNNPYILLDINMGIRLGRRLNLSASIKNITNTEYMGRPGDIRPPRSFSLRLNGVF
jgi:iron complex outermembrane receptor protein